jgi:vacuolar protein sorting-associated protein 26
LTGGGNNLIMEIQLDPPTSASSQAVPIVVMDHIPSWKLHKNPFWKVQHPGGSKMQPVVVGGSPNMYDSQQLSSPHSQQSQQLIYAFEPSQTITGRVVFHSASGNKGIDHLGIKVQFIGRIDMSTGVHEGHNKPHYDFVSLSKELAPPGTLYPATTVLPFTFRTTMLQDSNDDDGGILESYHGRNVSVLYLIQVQMDRSKYLPPIKAQHEIWMQTLGVEPTSHTAIQMEVGIEDCLHIEFEYDRRVYHLTDTIRGKIHFLLVRIKIKHMELAVIRRETSGEGVSAAAQEKGGLSPAQQQAAGSPPPGNNSNSGDASNIFTETQTLVKYEIMDGAPVKGEVIPVKLSLQGIPADLTPTYTAANNRFSVRYFLNLVLVDEDDRRYFKQQEIILWRKERG